MSHHNRLINLYTCALAPRTWQNKAAHVRVYIDFCHQNKLRPSSPSTYDLMSFLLFLSDRLRSPGAILNYFSSVKVWVRSTAGGGAAFEAPELSTFKRGILKMSKHVVARATPVSPREFKAIILALSNMSPKPHVIIIALLIAYLTLIRQSNIANISVGATGSPHVLKAKDIRRRKGALSVTLRSSKTRSSSDPPVVFRLPAIIGSPCCPVAAWDNYSRVVTLLPESPAFLLADGTKLTLTTLTRALRVASYSAFGVDKGLTLHGLRRGATQACQGAGLTLDQLMAAGTWRSSAVNSYLRAFHISAAPAALATLLV